MAITAIPKTFTSDGKSIPAELFAPPGKANGGVIVIAHGSDGLNDTKNGPWKTMIEGYASDLADRGFVVLVPDCFASTNTKPLASREEIAQATIRHGAEWLTTLTDAVTAAKALEGVDPSQIGLLGFSLGGHLCLRLRALPKVLVAFYAPVLLGLGPSGALTLQAQIHHGKADDLVPYDLNVPDIDKALRASGVSPVIFLYEAAGHGFKDNDAANRKALDESKGHMIAFFEEHLKLPASASP